MEELVRLAAQLRDDEARAGATRAALHAAIRAALAAGYRQADIGRATGYSRERLRQIAADR